MSEKNGTAGVSQSPLGVLEMELLRACGEMVDCQRELLDILAKTIGDPPNEVFYTWMRRTIPQRWQLDEGWKCYFHGHECDLSNADGRLLRLDFGPGGRVDTFTTWGLLRYVMTSKPPWPEYPELRLQFAKRGEKTNSFGGRTDAIGQVWDRLAARGAFEPAYAKLIEFQKRHTTIGADGIQRVVYPAETSEELMFDCSVAHRTVLSSAGRRLLNQNARLREGLLH